jgi:hypothetical protein
MTPIRFTADALRYQFAVIGMYLDLPQTPVHVSHSDRQQAVRWWDSGVPLRTVQTALLLGSLRRLLRPAAAPRLAPIRSLAYFQPVVEELLQTPVADDYCGYLQGKMKAYLRDHPDWDPHPDPP